jgi:phage regulator Rha-like protein
MQEMITTTATTFEKITEAGAITPTTLNGLPGMSSLEIAEITGKKHHHILRDIRKMLDALKINPTLDTSPKCVETQFPDSYGRLQPLTILDKELTLTLLGRYSFEMSNLIVKRWLELEGSGFERVSVQATVVHLIEREKDNRRAAFHDIKKAMKKTPRRPLSLAEKEHKRLNRLAYRNSQTDV